MNCICGCRWKDALVGCFKPGRYPHLQKTAKKKEGLSIYALVDPKAIPDKSLLKPSMLHDVPRSHLPQDFDMENPLVPLKGTEVAGVHGAPPRGMVTTGVDGGAPHGLDTGRTEMQGMFADIKSEHGTMFADALARQAA